MSCNVRTYVRSVFVVRFLVYDNTSVRVSVGRWRGLEAGSSSQVMAVKGETGTCGITSLIWNLQSIYANFEWVCVDWFHCGGYSSPFGDRRRDGLCPDSPGRLTLSTTMITITTTIT